MISERQKGKAMFWFGQLIFWVFGGLKLINGFPPRSPFLDQLFFLIGIIGASMWGQGLLLQRFEAIRRQWQSEFLKVISFVFFCSYVLSSIAVLGWIFFQYEHSQTLSIVAAVSTWLIAVFRDWLATGIPPIGKKPALQSVRSKSNGMT